MMKYELLVVDDDANIRKAIGLSLASPERNITLAASAEEAIEFIKKKDIRSCHNRPCNG